MYQWQHTVILASPLSLASAIMELSRSDQSCQPFWLRNMTVFLSGGGGSIEAATAVLFTFKFEHF